MQKKHIFFTPLLLVIITIVISSCRSMSSTRQSEQSTSRDILGVGVVQIPVVADLEITSSERVSHTETINVEDKDLTKLINLAKTRNALNFGTGKKNIQNLENIQRENADKSADGIKAIAKSKLLIKYGADVLIDPRYSIQIVDNKTITVTVSGYIGKYKNFRNIQPKDTALLKPVYWVRPNNEIGTIETQR